MDSHGTHTTSMYPENRVYAQEFWYIIAAATAIFACIRIGRAIRSRLRYGRFPRTLSEQIVETNRFHSVRQIRIQPDSIPSRPSNIVSQIIATSTAILRESTYWQPWRFKSKYSRYFTPPPAGRCIIVALYWLTILTMLFQNTILQPDDSMYVYRWEKMGYRAAWISITQIPFIYLTATKLNPMSLLSGISYERLNYLHRWASRTVFVTVIFHWSYFFTEWSLADIVQLVFELMPMVTYGFIAWGILGWQVLTSFGFFRSMCYELWVFQHIASAGVLLWALYMHIPAYARYNIWMSIGFVAFDQVGRLLWNVVQNVGLLRRGPKGMSLGYNASLEALPDGYTKVRIPNIHFTWRAGQHVYLSIPRIGAFEAHPFTIANHQDCDQENGSRTINFLIKAQSGFSRRIHEAAQRNPKTSYKAFLSGPWGNPPNLSSYETIIFIANSTGATYNLPLFQQIAKTRNCSRNVVFSWVCKESCQINWFQDQILEASEEITANGAKVSVRIGCTGGVASSTQICCCRSPLPPSHDTNNIDINVKDPVGGKSEKGPDMIELSCFQGISPPNKQSPTTTTKTSSITSTSSSSSTTQLNTRCTCICALRTSSLTEISTSRPELDSIILPAIEAARGETAIICCGRDTLMAEVRNYVAHLSDERAVHKGSGALGIFLWGEGFGW